MSKAKESVAESVDVAPESKRTFPLAKVGQIVLYYERGDQSMPPVAAIVTAIHPDNPELSRINAFRSDVGPTMPVPGWVRHINDPFHRDHYQALLLQGAWQELS